MVGSSRCPASEMQLFRRERPDGQRGRAARNSGGDRGEATGSMPEGHLVHLDPESLSTLG